MIMHDSLPNLICNECALHLSVASNLKGKCLTSEKYFLDYLNAETDTKNHLLSRTIPELVSVPVAMPDLPVANSPPNQSHSDNKIFITLEEQLPSTAENTSENNAPIIKYIRPNLMAYFSKDAIIELSDTDTDTDKEEEAVDINNEEVPTKNTYECPACPKKFTDLFDFNNHVRDHESKVCKVCGRICGVGSNLITHFRTHRPDQKIKCPNCDYSSVQKVTVGAHIRKYHNDGVEDDIANENLTTKCNKCGIYFSSIEEFRIHLYADHTITVQDNTEAGKFMTLALNSDVLKCKVCSRQLKNSISFSLHMKLHETCKLKYCYVCKKSFRNNMFLHFKICHPGQPPYKCVDHCNKTFSNCKLFEAHQRNVKRQSGSSSKNISTNTLDSSSVNGKSRYSVPSDIGRNTTNLAIPPIGYGYVLIGQRVPLECYTCDLKFESELLLTEHAETHKSKECKKCHRIFGNFRALAGHYKLKHPRTEITDCYECRDCGKTFDKFYSLKRHQVQHHKEKNDT